MENKNKGLKVTIVILTILVIGLGCFIGYDKIFKKSKNENAVENKKSEDELSNNNENLDINIEKLMGNIIERNSAISLTLYQYINSGEKDLNKYLNNLDNNSKSYLGGIIYRSRKTNTMERNYSFNAIKENLVNLFGTDLGIEAKDYYVNSTEKKPLLIYNSKTNQYSENPDYDDGEFITDLDYTSLYNYQLKNIEINNQNIAITYYGLYYEDDGIEDPRFKNNRNINAVIGSEGQEYLYFFESSFAKNKNDFLKFKYIFTKKGNDYILTGVEKVS